jgi:hypothetical protein
VRTSVRDSTYVQDGILENQTELPMENQDVFIILLLGVISPGVRHHARKARKHLAEGR